MITKMRGFTLIETLLALAILAVLSAAAVMVLQNVIRADGLTREKSLQIAALQRAFRQIADDVTHIIPRRARNSDTFFFAGRFQLRSDDWGLAFSRSGWPNPLGILPRSEIQNVSYRLRQQQLERLSFDQQDPLTGSQPTVRVLLREVGREKPATVKRMLNDIYRQNRTDVKGIRTKKYGIGVEVLGIYVFNDVIYIHSCISNDTKYLFRGGCAAIHRSGSQTRQAHGTAADAARSPARMQRSGSREGTPASADGIRTAQTDDL